ncbi:MAG: general secretion pathway protein F [Kiritimatiellia bacterium]|jgi:general secretion pathway protein F
MAVFEYRGMDKGGKAVSGIIDADNPKVARGRLRKQGVFPTDIKLQKKGGRSGVSGQGLNVEIDLSKYIQFVSVRDISVLTRQMATLLGASVPMAETLNALVDQSEKQRLKVVLSEIKEQVNQGSTLADSLSKHPRIFNNLFVQMVRAGEHSGALPTVLKRLAIFSESQVKLRGKIMGAMIYPIMMSIIGAAILMGLFLFVVPQMRDLLEGFSGNQSLPIITQVVFFVGDSMTSGFACVMIVLGVVGFFVFRWWTRNGGKYRWHAFLLKVPLFGRLSRLIAVSQFCRTLSTLLVSGVPIITALGIVKNVVGNVVIKKAIDDAAKNIQEGQSIAAPLRRSGQFPPMVVHMIAIGERTGELENMLVNVADAYEAEVDSTVEGLTQVLGPLMIVAMGGIVMFIAIGLLLPMVNISQQFM